MSKRNTSTFLTMLCWTFTSRYRRTKVLFRKLAGRLWHIYKAATKRHFAQRLRQLREWATVKVKQQTVRQRKV